MVFHDAHWINCFQRLVNIPSENQQRLVRLNEYSKFQSGGIQTQLEAVPLVSNNAIQSLRLLSISTGMFDPFPAIAGRPLCTDEMWICGCWKPHRDFRSYRVRRIIGSIIKKAFEAYLDSLDPITYLGVTRALGSPRPSVHCHGSHRKRDELGLDT